MKAGFRIAEIYLL